MEVDYDLYHVPQPMHEELHDPKCLPLADWHTKSFPNCNSIHEINMPLAAMNKTVIGEEDMDVLGEGWFRTTWRLDNQVQHETTVLKTLRIEREFLQEYYELHRRDAVAMERLTWSNFVVDIFGYCGQSAINEIADFPSPDIKDLEKFDRRLRHNTHPKLYKVKLQMAASVAQGLADIHSIDGDRPTMVHYDINPRNIALFDRGRPKINDFNIAEFIRYDPVTNKTCGFPNRMHQPWWRAPEEVSLTKQTELDEKVDVFALGSVLYHILTTHSPYGKMKAEFMEPVRTKVLQGIKPELRPPYNNETNPITIAFRKAMDRCWEYDPKKRASSQEIVDILIDALVEYVNKEKEEEKMAKARVAHAQRASRTAPKISVQVSKKVPPQATTSEE